MAKIDPESRKRWGLSQNDPGPLSLPKMGFARNAVRTPQILAGMTPKDGGASPPSGVETARDVLEKAALGADMASIGLAAGGITAPVAVATKGLGVATELGLGAINGYDAVVNGNWGPIEAQAASLPFRLIPGGRTLQRTAKAIRGPARLLRDGAGRFRGSVLNNDAIEKAGQIATERAAGAIAGQIFDR